MTWNPRQYAQFADARQEPLRDLLALVDKRPRLRAVDLGCGSGASTSALADALPEGDILALDSSAEMLARAQPRAGVSFQQRSIEDFALARGAPFDLVFSNAALHWVPDHPRLLPALWSRLADGGQLAVQLPVDDDTPARRVFAEVAGWRHRLHTLDARAYAELLFALGAGAMTVYDKVYPHVLADADAVLGWARGTALLPYLARLSPDDKTRYLDEVRRRLAQEYAGRPVFFPFRRIIFYAQRA